MRCELIYCSRCGAENKDDAMKCKSCGASLRRIEDTRQRKRREDELARLSWRLRRALARTRAKEVGWLKRILENADEQQQAEIIRYAIERIEYSARNPMVPTGINELDDILYGGIPEGYAILLTSPPIDERDILMESFLKDGIDRDEVVLLISTRLRGDASELVIDKPESFFLLLCSLRANLMVEDGPNILKFQGIDNLTQLNISLEVLLRDILEQGKKLRRVVIDIVSDTLMTHEMRVVRRWLTELLTMFKSMNSTILSSLDPGMHTRDKVRTVLDLFDGHIDIEEREVEGEWRKTLTVRRMYRKKYLDKELILEREKLTQRK